MREEPNDGVGGAVAGLIIHVETGGGPYIFQKRPKGGVKIERSARAALWSKSRTLRGWNPLKAVVGRGTETTSEMSVL